MAYVFLTGSAAKGNTTVDSTGATLMVAAIGFTTIFTHTDITDSAGNAWAEGEYSDGDAAISVHFKQNPTTSATHNVSVGLGTQSIAVMCFSGGTNNKAQSNGNNSGTSGVTTLGITVGLTPSAINQLGIVALGTEAGNAVTLTAVNSGYTIGAQAQAINGNRRGVSLAYLINPALSSLAPTFTWSGSNQAAIAQLIFGAPPATGDWKLHNGLMVPSSTTLKVHNGTALASIKLHNGLTP